MTVALFALLQESYHPHGYCYHWERPLVWLHAGTDTLIALSYFTIPIGLVWLVRKRRDIPFDWMFVAFAVFIVACGSTHVMAVWNLWNADYWLSGAVKSVTAAASLITAVLMVPFVPKVLHLPSAEQLRSEIAERQRAEEEARHARILLEAVLASLAEGVVAVDQHGKSLFWNPAATRMVGQDAPNHPLEAWPEHLGVFREDGVTPFLGSEVALSRAIRGESVDDEIQCLKRPDLPPEGLWVTATARPLVDEDGLQLGGVVSFEDITKRRAQEGEVERLSVALQEQVTRLGEVNDELRSFAYTVSHDLRAPLRAVQGFANALVEDYTDQLPEEGREYAHRVSDAAVRMDGLIQDLLEYSRLSQAEFELTPVDLNTVLNVAREQVNSELQAMKATIEIDPVRLPTVLGHERTLTQIVANLLSNAAKFVSPGSPPLVRIRAERRGQMVRLWVEDNGIGIAPEHTDRIFRVFERLHGRERYPGTGIGLAIVRKGTQRMGGTSGVESTLGEGSRFWIELPVTEVAE